MKVIGLMVTYNELHFLPYSFPVLYELVEETFILDGSTDETRKYLNQFLNVNVFHEENYEPMTYKERRQFVLDRAREKYGLDNVYIVIDADEIISLELINDLKRIIKTEPGPYTISCNWTNPFNDFDHSAFTWNYMNPMQGIMFRDHGLNHIGNNIVHENKMPYYDHEIKLTQSCLIHFGLCNKRYMRSKGRYYMLLEYLEDPCNRTVSYLNLRYSRGVKPVKIFDNYTYPYFIDDKIFDVDLYIEKYDNKLINLVMNNKDKLDKLYRLDIWDNKILYNYRKEHIKFYDLSNLHYINRNYHWIKMIFSIERLLCLLNNRDFDLVYNHLLKVMRIRK